MIPGHLDPGQKLIAVREQKRDQGARFDELFRDHQAAFAAHAGMALRKLVLFLFFFFCRLGRPLAQGGAELIAIGPCLFHHGRHVGRAGERGRWRLALFGDPLERIDRVSRRHQHAPPPVCLHALQLGFLRLIGHPARADHRAPAARHLTARRLCGGRCSRRWHGRRGSGRGHRMAHLFSQTCHEAFQARNVSIAGAQGLTKHRDERPLAQRPGGRRGGRWGQGGVLGPTATRAERSPQRPPHATRHAEHHAGLLAHVC